MSSSQGLHLRENMNKGVFVDGLVEEVIDNPGDAYQVSERSSGGFNPRCQK